MLNCNITFGGRRMMTCQISDGSGILTMRFFNFSAAMKNSLATGRRVLAYGEAKRGKYGAEMIHPEYRVQGDLSTPELQETLTPVYPTTEGVKQATLRKLTDQALGPARYLRYCRTAAARVVARYDEPARSSAHIAPSTAVTAVERSGNRSASSTATSDSGRIAGA